MLYRFEYVTDRCKRHTSVTEQWIKQHVYRNLWVFFFGSWLVRHSEFDDLARGCRGTKDTPVVVTRHLRHGLFLVIAIGLGTLSFVGFSQQGGGSWEMAPVRSF